MTTSKRQETWASLAPWEKAAQWLEAAPELAGDVVAMAKLHAEHTWRMEEDQARHDQEMETRLWYTQMASLAINLLSLAMITVIALKFGRDAALPAVTVFGTGGGLTAGSYLVSRSIRKSWQAGRTGRSSGAA